MNDNNGNITNLCDKGQDLIQSLLEATIELMKECKTMQIYDKSEDKFKSKVDNVVKTKNLLIQIVKDVEKNRDPSMSFSKLTLDEKVLNINECTRLIEHQKLVENSSKRLKELRDDLRDLQYLLSCGADVNTYVNSKDPIHYNTIL